MEGRYKIEKSKKKALVTVHLGRHFRIFGQYDYQVLKSLGYEVHIAANFTDEVDHFEDADVIKHQISFDRNPFSKSNIAAYFQLKKIFKENYFEVIQTQSPSAGVVTRLSARKERRKGSKVFYTPHGYHFYKGSSKLRWFIFYPIEKIMGFITDVIITINKEDYDISLNRKIAKKIYQIPGVGVDDTKYFPISEIEKNIIKEKLDFPKDKLILSYIGELSIRKNQMFLLESLIELNELQSNIQLMLVGTGNLEGKLKDYVKENNLVDMVSFLGYRTDVDEILKVTDIVLSSSTQEGLPVNIMESMFSGKPIIASNCRGNRDLVIDDYNGFIFEVNDKEEFSKKLLKLFSDPELRNRFGKKSLELASKYKIESVSNKMKEIYTENI
ncbi:glycosyltransferase family 4 protein [Vagococcus fluvialis]|uniref:glycosyltransferase family 4 protein n=1 Tax=Vagococcus fluvialis TaxID=2738 RepID=UPI001A8EB52A|nr:glycosyltransferase family 4 protein [Vagococcus fluvialis]MBO0442877.1 glycosyltransferase family 4 protein [Vagococcus fluvialis]